MILKLIYLVGCFTFLLGSAFSSTLVKPNCKLENGVGDVLGYRNEETIVDLFKRAVEKYPEKGVLEFENCDMAFHQPFSEGHNYFTLAEQYYFFRTTEEDNKRVDGLTGSCHPMAETLRELIGVGKDQRAKGLIANSEGEFGVGQLERIKSLNFAIDVLRKGEPAILTIANRGDDDGHSFSLVLRPDGKVDSLEGWAKENKFIPITTGRRRNLDVKDVIKALETLKLDPTKRENDRARTKAYNKIQSAYDKSTDFHNIGSHRKTVELLNIPKKKSGKRMDLPEWGKNGYKDVYYYKRDGEYVISAKDMKTNRREHIRSEYDLTERRDDHIQIDVMMRPLKNAQLVIEALDRQYQDQLRLQKMGKDQAKLQGLVNE